MDTSRLMRFCPRCFADEETGSWRHVVTGSHCTNCGSSSTIDIPAWAIGSIREQASWVGKRYYPIEEDRQARKELALLRSKMTEFPGRSVRFSEGNGWVVEQRTGPRTITSVFITADNAEEALAAAKTMLPYTEQDWT